MLRIRYTGRTAHAGVDPWEGRSALKGAELFGTGIQFGPVSGDHLEAAILRAAELWRDRGYWRQMQQNAMATDVSWRRPAAAYARLFRALAAAA